MRVALFATCIVDAMYPKVALATVRILERLGHEVVFPRGQGCCAQMHVNSGYLDDALPVVKNHVRTFQGADYDVAVAPSGSCVASLGHQQPMVARAAGDEALARDAEEVAANTYELAALLTDVLGVTDAAAQLGSWFPHTVTYHPSCHGMRLLRLGDRQERLLRSVADIDYHALPDAEECCGFGGTFSLKNPDVSGAMAEEKIGNIERTQARLCTGGDASCLLHLGGVMSRRGTTAPDGSPVTTLHFAEILAATRENPLDVSGPVDLSIPAQGPARRRRQKEATR
ncbi:Fe-S oxidoreductase [Micrococcus luteus]|jgi:L-lactate dehydrogenase complex protein LldE|uniref:Fe-S oxidoreductase n=1 Tax=Micrococcus luteus (strain ATCC 4698 / DSM 20030 / JCM 1464 / CCM 169 / CCUG 5858 / IAM 1056 / NBRC 3333 / NCIMB 9278 / NCTC 2665 / VKM Ac-2230) TaxID=465515 RepID=C5C6X2_MICLC|nr:(Fe-S)-binding protein [Micrococcus luteus]ACS31460.1 Fe-S oxidoreductase [Micrococcus luteus NCTC 2665]AJO56513.1 Fe-S osidoreductase [Micrococcus luteus]KAB1902621.1 (Fe-S)-binding protein [Micrococcus luteus NCTC 2665]ORE60372.1 Fe-S oxidoreductase [Micrococcus luteus]QCY44722.1 (Fe-S)-binding protein [Micrococcus luteus]